MKMEAMSAVNKGLFKESFDKHNQKPLVTFYSTTEALMFSCPCVIVTLRPLCGRILYCKG